MCVVCVLDQVGAIPHVLKVPAKCHVIVSRHYVGACKLFSRVKNTLLGTQKLDFLLMRSHRPVWSKQLWCEAADHAKLSPSCQHTTHRFSSAPAPPLPTQEQSVVPWLVWILLHGSIIFLSVFSHYCWWTRADNSRCKQRLPKWTKYGCGVFKY